MRDVAGWLCAFAWAGSRGDPAYAVGITRRVGSLRTAASLAAAALVVHELALPAYLRRDYFSLLVC